ncbi:MAG: hypothetical protein M3258_04415 [Thermoproteota archaeon]|nr:hypothetical protein [Thermoproteota archaeon]
MSLKYEVYLEAKDSRRNSEDDDFDMKNIKVADDIHRELGEIGKLSENFSDVVRRLLEHYKNCPEVDKLAKKTS